MKQLMLPYFDSHTTVFVKTCEMYYIYALTLLSTEADYTNHDHPACNCQSDNMYNKWNCFLNERKVHDTFDIL